MSSTLTHVHIFKKSLSPSKISIEHVYRKVFMGLVEMSTMSTKHVYRWSLSGFFIEHKLFIDI